MPLTLGFAPSFSLLPQDLEAATGKTLGGDASKARKIDDLRNDVAKLECSISAARAEYDRITGINQQVRFHGMLQES
jgi:hypothetical protein